jgi:RNA recognition motif-containing protein
MQSTALITTKTLLIGNLPENTPSTALAELFRDVGKVLEIALLPHGFAFVEMKAPDADRALVQLNGRRWNGQVVMIDEAHPRRDSKY